MELNIGDIICITSGEGVCNPSATSKNRVCEIMNKYEAKGYLKGTEIYGNLGRFNYDFRVLCSSYTEEYFNSRLNTPPTKSYEGFLKLGFQYYYNMEIKNWDTVSDEEKRKFIEGCNKILEQYPEREYKVWSEVIRGYKEE